MRRIALASLVLALLTGCADTIVDDTSSSGSGNNNPYAAYKIRRAIKISGTAPAGYSLSFSLEHAKLVKDGKARKDGKDVRVVHDNGGNVTELNRVIDPTSKWEDDKVTIWFRTVDQPEGSYFLYYGNDGAPAAMEDATKVYDVWEDFNGEVTDPAWQPIGKLGKADGKFEVKKGVLRVTGQSKDFGDVADDGVLFYRSVSGDFTADVAIAAVGGSLGGSSKLGGLMVRQNIDPDSVFAMVTLQDLPRQRVSMSRVTKAMPATSTPLPIPDSPDKKASEKFPQLVQVTRLATQVATSYSDDGSTWISIGAPANLADMKDPVLVGVPFSNISSDFGYTEIAWLRITKRATPPPTVQLGPE